MTNPKPIPGFEGLYDVTEDGRVYSHRAGRYMKLQPWGKGDGYLRATLQRDGKRVDILVHRLVLTTFVGPEGEGEVCNHKDGDKHNNSLSNLEWVTHQENVQHAHANGLMNPPKGDDHWRRQCRH